MKTKFKKRPTMRKLRSKEKRLNRNRSKLRKRQLTNRQLNSKKPKRKLKHRSKHSKLLASRMSNNRVL